VPRIRVVVVDDHPVVREGLTSILADVDDIQVVGVAATGAAALEVVARMRPDVCLTDLHLPDMTGIDLCAAIDRSHPEVRTILLSSRGDGLTFDAAFSAGARGFVLKSSDPGAITDAIRVVAGGDVVVDAVLTARGERTGNPGLAKGPFGLTAQELRVLEQLPRGLTNKGIGTVLNISEDTVKTHLKRILFKLRAHDRAEAVAIAHREGLL
jgi:DNA-binding NarL/FixJ family response regulator